ncbi:hypothetical protein, partial [Mycoplasmopsis bovis]|uniref:hypothetical protein n=1 Tax=Mycoplasmopsis bovis TaxID=28903 RepID=UPI003D2C325F
DFLLLYLFLKVRGSIINMSTLTHDKYQNKYPYKVRKFGPMTERRDYSATKVTWEVPDFLNMSKESFEWFKKSGIEETFLLLETIG